MMVSKSNPKKKAAPKKKRAPRRKAPEMVVTSETLGEPKVESLTPETDEEFDQGAESNRSRALQAGALPSDLEGKRPDFEASTTLMEYHEIPPSKQQGGVRLKMVIQMPKLTVGENAKLVKRIKYGMLRISYFPNEDSVAAIDLRGKLEIVEEPPAKADKEGKRVLNFWPGDPVAGDVSDALLQLRRRGDLGVTVNMAFWGSYNQQDMFGEKKETADIDA